jgi:branched-chain amino acid transport system substrate-binding protein
MLILGIFGISKFDNKNQTPDQPLKVGALLLLSGDFTSYGERSQNAIEIAVDEYNANPNNKRKVEVVYEDTHGDPKQAVSAYTKLVNVDKVDAIVGPLLQAEAAAITPLIEKDKIPVFSVAPVPIERRSSLGNPLVVWPDPTLEAEQMAQYVFDDGIRSVGIVGTQDSWENEVSEAFAKKFQSLGGTVTSKEITLQTEKDVRLPATKVISTKPEAIFLGTYYQFFPFVKSIREQGYKGKLYSIEIDTYLAEQTKSLSDGLKFISPDSYTDDFIKEFNKRYGQNPTLPAGQAHDAMGILLSLFSKYGDKDDVLKAMVDFKQYDGVSGPISFDNHKAIFPLSIFEIQNGIIQKLK